jgi:deoxyribodipyrimidine photo-lyase
MNQTELFVQQAFKPSMQAAQARLAAVNPHAYALTRNALGGAVTQLSPYITHGFLTLPEVLQNVHARHPLAIDHKFVYELGWRAYFHHVWEHGGDGIFTSLHQGPLPDDAYTSVLPPDIRQARTGIPAIDMAVRTLYATGYLHNHARMWLASYIVHVRRVHWRAGADWLFGHLLDGDLASNHLSWQWVAGTGSHKPYLFNAANVAKYAPQDWHSPGTCIDVGYDVMEKMARGGKLPRLATLSQGMDEPRLAHEPPLECGFTRPEADAAHGRRIRLIHPWSLGEGGSHASSSNSNSSNDSDSDNDMAGSKEKQATDRLTIAVFPSELSARWPWSPARWRFVAQAMAAQTPHCWFTNAAGLTDALRGAKSVSGTSNLHLPAAWRDLGLGPTATFFQPPDRRYHSFSQYWNAATGRLGSVDALLGIADGL